jgi:hypothetical protein
MANYREIVRHVPAVRLYIRNRRWVRRGDVTAYAPNLEGGAFSTDEFGFRHGDVDGERHGLATALAGARYGLVLGSSHVFGFGLDSNSQTIPSRLSVHTGLPCLNISFPEADLRTLHAAAARITAETPRPPAFISCFVGGTLSRYCYTRRCDPLFGPPDFLGGETDGHVCGAPPEIAAFNNLLAYVRFWLDQILALAERHRCPLIVHAESTAFEKTLLDEQERACALTQPDGAAETARFATHRLRNATFLEHWLAAAKGRALEVSGAPHALSFIDEFHYTAAASERIARDVAERLAAGRDTA